MAEFWQYASLSSHAYSLGSGDVPGQAYFVPEGFSEIDPVSRANGLFARAYLEAWTGKVIVAVHGTNFNEIEDLKTDVALALGIDTSGLVPTQVTDLADFVADLIV